MLDQDTIANIREAGIAQGPDAIKDWNRLLREEFGFRTANKAEYALIAGCYNPYIEPNDMKAFRKLLDHFEIDYTLIPKEHCCGSLFFWLGVDKKNAEDIEQAGRLVREFIGENLKQIREAGASKIIFYCSGCDMMYEMVEDLLSEEYLWHPKLFAPLFTGGRLELQADYFSGCHRRRQVFNSTMPDLDSVTQILNRIEGLELNHLNHRLCCNDEKQVQALIGRVKNKTIITPCAGCSMYLRQALQDKGDYRLFMLSEVMWAAINGHTL